MLKETFCYELAVIYEIGREGTQIGRLWPWLGSWLHNVAYQINSLKLICREIYGPN